MPDASFAASFDQSTSFFPRVILLTVAPKDKNAAPVNAITLEFGAYAWKDYEWVPPAVPEAAIEPNKLCAKILAVEILVAI